MRSDTNRHELISIRTADFVGWSPFFGTWRRRGRWSPRDRLAPKFVTPYRMSGKRGKNDAADAAAICETVTRANMRFVPIKEEHQQIILPLHRMRQGFVEERTATYNRMRGLMSTTN